MTTMVPFTMVGEAADREPRELAALGRAREWINSPPLTVAGLRGKVVLVDFCTYTCINWLRTLPYRRAWAQKYRDGVVVVGVHTPEFPFEQDLDNVRRALRQLNVAYPIAIDNDYAIWRAFGNRYWPALYFVDGRGRVRDRQFGEGEYARCEQVIQRLLADGGVAGASREPVTVEGTGLEAPADWNALGSPETYLAYDRASNFASRGGLQRDRRRVYAVPERLALNQWALAGDWAAGPQAVTLASPGGRVACRFHARDVHLVMRPSQPGRPIRFRVSIDGEAPGAARGGDVDDAGSGILAEPRLHQLIRQPGPILDRRFDIEFLDPGAEVYAFTFG